MSELHDKLKHLAKAERLLEAASAAVEDADEPEAQSSIGQAISDVQGAITEAQSELGEG